MRKYKYDVIGTELILEVNEGDCARRQTGDGWPEEQPWHNVGINGMHKKGDTAGLAALGLAIYVAPAPTPPTFEEYQAQKLSQVRSEAGVHIEQAYPPFHQRNVALGLYPEGTMTTDIESVITESNRVEDAIAAALDIAGVDTAYATLNWPVIGG